MLSSGRKLQFAGITVQAHGLLDFKSRSVVNDRWIVKVSYKMFRISALSE